MFLDSEVLYKNGPFAVIWLIGNGQLTRSMKGRFNEAVAKVQVLPLCQKLYEYFPIQKTRKGSVFGLRQLAIVINGLSIVHHAQVDVLLQNVSGLYVKLNSRSCHAIKVDSGSIGIRGLKAGEEEKNAGPPFQLKEKDAKDFVESYFPTLAIEELIGQHELIVARDSNLLYPEYMRKVKECQASAALGSKPNDDLGKSNRGPKRRLDGTTVPEEEALLEMFSNLKADPRAHTMIETELPQHTIPDIGFFDDVTGNPTVEEQRMMEDFVYSSDGEDKSVVAPEHNTAGENTEIPPEVVELEREIHQRSSTFGAQDEGIAGGSGQNSFNLDTLNVEGSPSRRALGKGLKIDKVTHMPHSAHSALITYIRAGYKVVSDELLEDYWADRSNRPEPDARKRQTGLDFIGNSGRKVLSKHFQQGIGEFKRLKLDQRLSKDSEPEVVRQRGSAKTSASGRVSLVADHNSASGGASLVAGNTSASGVGLLHTVDESENVLEEPGAPEYDVTGGQAQGEVAATGPSDMQMTVEEEGNATYIEVTAYPTPPRHAVQSGNNSPPLSPPPGDLNLFGGKVFTELMPHGKPRREAATLFAKLLKFQKKKELFLIQDEWFGRITISPID